MKILRKACASCDFAQVERIPRTFWMRLLPSLRHYYCRQCKVAFVARKGEVESRQWMLSTFKGIAVDASGQPAGGLVGWQKRGGQP
jgi:hypothetical protein